MWGKIWDRLIFKCDEIHGSVTVFTHNSFGIEISTCHSLLCEKMQNNSLRRMDKKNIKG